MLVVFAAWSYKARAVIYNTVLYIMAAHSTRNSTDIPLDNAETWTGGPDQVGTYSAALISCITDQNGQLTIQSSYDATEWYDDQVIAYTTAATPLQIVVPVAGKHFRLKFLNNSGSNQTNLDIFTKYTSGIAEVHIADALATEASLAAAMSSLSSLDGKTTTIDTSAVLLVARQSSGSHNNLVNNTTLVSGASSATVDTSGIDIGHVFIRDSATASVDAYSVEVSIDGGTVWYVVGAITPVTTGGVRLGSLRSIDLGGIDEIRVSNTSGSDDYTACVAGIVGAAR